MYRRVFKPRRAIVLVLFALLVRAGLAISPSLPEGDRALAAAVSVPAVTEVAPPPAPPAPAGPAEAAAAEAAPAATPVVDGFPIPADRLGVRPILIQVAQEYGLPADLMLAQAWAESSWRTDAVSYARAAGVLQLTPESVEFISRRLLKLDHELDPFDPVANARMAARFMQHLLHRTGDVRMALIAYNQGLTALLRNGPYQEAVAYADRVIALRPQFA